MTDLPTPIEQASLVWHMAAPDRELRQCEVITQLVRNDYNSSDGKITPVDLPFSIIFSQDCDLLDDFNNRAAGGDGQLDHVLLMNGVASADVKSLLGFGSKEMKPLHQNLNPRWHYLEICPASVDAVASGFDAVVIDFRSISAVPVSEVYFQSYSGTAFRRAVLATPYLEHFQVRAAAFLCRVALPAPHKF